MTTTTRLGHRQVGILRSLLDGPAASILALEPSSDFVHTWHYRAVHTLARRGLVTLTPAPQGNSIGVAITDAGIAAVS